MNTVDMSFIFHQIIVYSSMMHSVQQLFSWCCRDQFAEFSYLRAADKKNGIPEHLEKTVLFLVDPSAVAEPEPSTIDCDIAAAAAKEREAEATVAMKAAWKVAKEAKEVSITCPKAHAALECTSQTTRRLSC